jgi:hypothetical protein
MPAFAGAHAGSTNERGYGNTHQRTRRQAFALLQDGAPCITCGRPMRKDAVEVYDHGRRTRSALHWDHNDVRDGYLGFSHARCNTLKGAAKGGRIALARRRHHPKPWRSRDW